MSKEKKKLSKRDLSEKVWFRLFKVIIYAVYLVVFILAILMLLEYAPELIVDRNATYFQCFSKNNEGKYNQSKNISLEKAGISLYSVPTTISPYIKEEIKKYCDKELRVSTSEAVVSEIVTKNKSSWFKALGYSVLFFMIGAFIVSRFEWLFFYIILGYQPKEE